MLDYFLSSDWAIIASELLAGFIVLTVVLAVLVWRGQRRHTDAAERLLEDRDPIARASEEMVERQIQRIWPEIQLDEVQRSEYAERSLDAVEALVEPWLEPKRYELSSVARSLLQVRQADLEQVLNLALAQCESKDDEVDPRMGELERSVAELRQTSDRQAKQLGEALETVNIMVREYGRKFDYDKEPRVSTLLQAIVMLDEMDAGADCETARQRARDLVSEDLIAAPSELAEDTDQSEESAGTETEEPAFDDASATQETTPREAEEPVASASEGTQADEGTEAETVGESVDTEQQAKQTQTDEEVGTSENTTEEPEQSSQSEDEPDIDDLIAQAQTEPAAVTATGEEADQKSATEENAPQADSGEPAEEGRADESLAADTASAVKPEEQGASDTAEQQPSPPTGEDVAAGEPVQEKTAQEDAQPGKEEIQGEEIDLDQVDKDRRQDSEDENSVIDLDEVEIPEEDKAEQETTDTDLDDIDALLDAEIARKHGKDQS
ncbi:hypothetical protein P8631_09440 [Guyparkeria sp. 1SP6A2]|nr:hypothetical protein [Guyparkeria sp. 1SP6A2]